MEDAEAEGHGGANEDSGMGGLTIVFAKGENCAMSKREAIAGFEQGMTESGRVI